MNCTDKVAEALAYIKEKIGNTPDVAIVLGSGLGKLADDITDQTIIPYEEIPHWPLSTAPGHEGRLVAGTLGGKKVVAMQGRLHFYEGYDMDNVVFPVRVFGCWGIKNYIASNASGGINHGFVPGDMVLIHDHINFMGTNPLIGANVPEWGDRFPDMSYAYDRELLNIAEEVARENNLTTRRGVYIAFTGPSYETPSEIRMARTMGADVVGMSTVPEVIVANHMGMSVFAVSCVANYAAGMTSDPLSEQEVLDEMAKSSENLTTLVRGVIERLEVH